MTTAEPSSLVSTTSVTSARGTSVSSAIACLIALCASASGTSAVVKVIVNDAGVAACCSSMLGASETSTPNASDAFAAVPSPLSRLSSTASADELSTWSVAVTTAEPSSLVSTTSCTSATGIPASSAIACLIAWRAAWSGSAAVVKVIATDEAGASLPSSSSVLPGSSSCSPSGQYLQVLAQWHFVPCAHPLSESHTSHSEIRAGQWPFASWSAHVFSSHSFGGWRSKHPSVSVGSAALSSSLSTLSSLQ